jgi:hypothetical protein
MKNGLSGDNKSLSHPDLLHNIAYRGGGAQKAGSGTRCGERRLGGALIEEHSIFLKLLGEKECFSYYTKLERYIGKFDIRESRNVTFFCLFPPEKHAMIAYTRLQPDCTLRRISVWVFSKLSPTERFGNLYIVWKLPYIL